MNPIKVPVFNLSFKPPSKDKCTRCDELEMKIKVEQDEDKKDSLINEKQRHLSKADMACASLKRDQESATDSVYVATFDQQKVLPFPKLTVSIAYWQNCNIKMTLGLLKIVQDPLMAVKVIYQKFVVPGHSYLPNDADFGIIEKALEYCVHEIG
ncbi:hypothetical protein ILUMI_14389 [Ignelater luminosus]|uniref:Uncharacterized protein n=1 Tax=Ignelater luminosus TaxID=2038154 RepID=A0A8K0CSK0_IGNLU|nr:hypothetical protein ILUMI_14389 [Ignelater luminosus]